MKKIIAFILMITSLCIGGCGKKEEANIEPQDTQMKAICELATMECYYHNVAKYTAEDAEGWWLWKKDMHFWVEYAGVVTIGIDTSLVKIDIKDEKVEITMPPAQVQNCTVDSATLTKDSFIKDPKSAEITPEAQTEAFKEAQAKMEKEAKSDKTLLSNAQQRAQKLLEDYVNNIGEKIGKQYKIKWVYVDENGKKL